MIYPFFRSLLFRLDPEQAHGLTLKLIRLAGSLAPTRAFLRLLYGVQQQPVETFGLRFPNPVGLAAGYDKDGLGWRGLVCLGFGHIEIGTVTVKAQPGNPKPRLFRIPDERAVINRMGFPGKGAHFVRRQISGPRPEGLVLGVNLGKNKDTPLDAAAGDYLMLMRIFAPLADYLAINVSSPNTEGLRRLQARQALEDLLGQLALQRQEILSGGALNRLPVLVKLSPDLSDAELDDAVEVILGTGMDGIIATNTTIGRDELKSPLAAQAGGLSGAPLRGCSTEMVRKIVQRTGGKLPVVGVGGIETASDVRQKMDAGATLVQVYTGMIYRGPGMVKQILTNLSQ